MTNQGTADWDSMWAQSEADVDTILREESTPRWQQIEHAVRMRFGGFDRLKVVEIGAGHGTNAIHFARRGAIATVIDTSAVALSGARKIADKLDLKLNVVEADLFKLPPEFLGAFDLSCSFGLAEHFLGPERLGVIRAHLEVIQRKGLAVIGVPNRWAPTYRAWMGVLKARGHWPLGTEVPFSQGELRTLIGDAGGQVLSVGYGSLPASIVNYLVNPVFHNAGRRGVRAPQVRSPLDCLAYELTAIAQRTDE